MPDQQSNAVQQPLQPQLDLESWSRSTGSSRALRDGWEKGASGVLIQRLATEYLKKVLEIYKQSKVQAGRNAHIWDLMHDEKSVAHVALESYTYVIGSLNEERSFNQICAIIGRRAEYVLWLTHPAWGNSTHLKGLKLASNNDLGMDLITKRLRDKGFRKASAYVPMRHAERAALGAFFVECIAESTHMIEVYVETRNKKRKRMIRYTSLYWEFLDRWKEATLMFRTVHMPMLTPPKPWTNFTDGGYLTIRTTFSSVPWERWPEVSKRALPCLVGSVNTLQACPYHLDHVQFALIEAVWNLGHAIGGVPSRERLKEPQDAWYKAQGLGPSAYWKAMWQYKGDRRQDGARSRLVNGLVAYHRLEDHDTIHLPWHIDHRGRLYSRGGQINPQGPDHWRSTLQFEERSPIKGHERAFAWSLGEALGSPPHPGERLRYLELMSTVIAKVGGDPLGNLGYWEGAKEPFRLIQLCRDWFYYLQDPGYCSGTIHWLDQTCSGWGHVACLTRDGLLAQYTNIVGSKPVDLYLGIGKLVEQRLRWLLDHEDQLTERKAKCVAWWCKHQIPRSLWKKALMPVIYGRSFPSLSTGIQLYLRDEVQDFLADDGLRIIDLALTLASTITDVVREALPNVRDLSRWLTKVSNMQIDAGLRPYWFTPNGLAVECWSSETRSRGYKLQLSTRTIRVHIRDATGCKPDKRRTSRKLVPDYIHSMDAAFVQRFVSHWATYQHPISTVHDCFGTTLEHVETLQSELNDQWHRFYSVDHLAKHQGMVAALLDCEVPPPPLMGTLELNRVGENPYLFC